MKLRHTTYPSPLVYCSAGKARFADFHFETSDKALAAALKKDPEIVEVKPKAAPKPETPQED